MLGRNSSKLEENPRNFCSWLFQETHGALRNSFSKNLFVASISRYTISASLTFWRDCKAPSIYVAVKVSVHYMGYKIIYALQSILYRTFVEVIVKDDQFYELFELLNESTQDSISAIFAQTLSKRANILSSNYLGANQKLSTWLFFWWVDE